MNYVNETISETTGETAVSDSSYSVSLKTSEETTIYSDPVRELTSAYSSQFDYHETSCDTAVVSYADDVSLDRVEGLLLVQVFLTAVIIGVLFSNIFFKRGG